MHNFLKPPLTYPRDLKLQQADMMISFARRRADILFALEPSDVASLASLDLAPRAHRDKRLLSALGRLNETFCRPKALDSYPRGSASFQDLLRVLRDWLQDGPFQHPPGEASGSAWSTARLISAQLLNFDI